MEEKSGEEKRKEDNRREERCEIMVLKRKEEERIGEKKREWKRRGEILSYSILFYLIENRISNFCLAPSLFSIGTAISGAIELLESSGPV